MSVENTNVIEIKNNNPINFTLRVCGGDNPTDPVGLSRSILHVLKENPDGWVNLQCVGAKSLFIACKAYQLSSAEIEKHTKSIRLVNTQWAYNAEIGGQ